MINQISPKLKNFSLQKKDPIIKMKKTSHKLGEDIHKTDLIKILFSEYKELNNSITKQPNLKNWAKSLNT